MVWILLSFEDCTAIYFFSCGLRFIIITATTLISRSSVVFSLWWCDKRDLFMFVLTTHVASLHRRRVVTAAWHTCCDCCVTHVLWLLRCDCCVTHVLWLLRDTRVVTAALWLLRDTRVVTAAWHTDYSTAVFYPISVNCVTVWPRVFVLVFLH